MSAQVMTEKSADEEEKRLIEEIEKKHGKTVQQLHDEREKRVRDALELKEPDRVPVALGTGVFAARYSGLTASVTYYDHAAYRAACKKMILEFEPDSGGVALAANSGLVMEILDPRHQRWPGGTLPPDLPYQFVEGEYMKADEYDLFLDDPSDFVLRYYLPRLFGMLAPLPKLPPIRTLIGTNAIFGIARMLVSPEFRKIGQALVRIEEEQARIRQEAADFAGEMERLGFPSPSGRGNGISSAPFDTISDHLRGMRGTMLDMYRCPDKLLAACDRILEWRIDQAVPATLDAKGNPRRVFMPLHRGSDGFMSTKDFEKFYWPGLKKAILTNIELGYMAGPFWEGVWDDRLEYLLELPRGKVVFHCEKTDIFKAKEVLGDHMCIQGGVPPTLLQAGTPQQVDEYCKKLIKVVGKGGGFILGSGSVIDYAKPANVKAMTDSVKKYTP